jgi:hypothetical protein
MYIGTTKVRTAISQSTRRWEDIIKMDVIKKSVRVGIELNWLRVGTVAGTSDIMKTGPY